jgi:hypothetical protein
MATIESAITRAESDLDLVESAIGAAHQVLEIADRTHRVGRGLWKGLKLVLRVSLVGVIVVAFALMIERLSRSFRRQESPETPQFEEMADCTDTVTAPQE